MHQQDQPALVPPLPTLPCPLAQRPLNPPCPPPRHLPRRVTAQRMTHGNMSWPRVRGADQWPLRRRHASARMRPRSLVHMRMRWRRRPSQMGQATQSRLSSSASPLSRRHLQHAGSQSLLPATQPSQPLAVRGKAPATQAHAASLASLQLPQPHPRVAPATPQRVARVTRVARATLQRACTSLSKPRLAAWTRTLSTPLRSAERMMSSA